MQPGATEPAVCIVTTTTSRPALSINSSDWPEPTGSGVASIPISGVVTVDFCAALKDWPQQTEGQGSSGGGAGETPDGDDGTDVEGECRCPADDKDARGDDER